MFFFLAVPSLHCCAGFSLVAVSQGYSLGIVCDFLLQGLLLLQCRGSRGLSLSGFQLLDP